MPRSLLPVFCLLLCAFGSASAQNSRPNVLLIITDDQGYGDLGLHGNDKIRTPHLDRLGRESVQLTQFLVNPVCSPTRASLLTGRYYYRTGVVDTFIGRSLMWPDEITLAELLSKGGYQTGLFGKWHLGDNYPMRPQDQGFGEVLVGRGGGLGQPSDEPGTVRERAYFDPVLQHNGRAEKIPGYCTDIFTDATIQFIEKNKERPFFAMLATNAPHDPLQVPEAYLKPYLDAGLPEKVARVYAMVTNLDDNIGRLLKRVDDLGLSQRTIVLFMTDNGPAGQRFNAGMRATKGTVYEGGIRVPCFVRWTGTLQPGSVDRMAAHIDITPTLLEACNVPLPSDRPIDGKSLLPLLRGGEKAATNWPDRTLHFQWHRGDMPELFRDSAARTQRWKLVRGKELYDLQADPAEKNDVAASNPEVVQKLRSEHEKWFADVTTRCKDNPSPIVLGSENENPSLLTRQDWRGAAAGWTPKSIGHWEVQVARGGNYRVSVLAEPATADREVQVRMGSAGAQGLLKAKESSATVELSGVEPGRMAVSAELRLGDTVTGPNYLRVERLSGQ
jgi:arylsulfatase A-like enzyme